MFTQINANKNKGVIFLISLSSFMLVAMLGYLDYITGPYLYFITFYLIPLYLATWFAGKWCGLIVLIASAVAWTVDDLSHSLSYVHPIIPYWNLLLKLSTFGFFIYILSSLKGALQRVNMLATTDFLTGIANRRYFFEAASREIDRCKRYGNTITVIYLDIDNFKYINDIHGHDAGDAVLRLIGRTLKENIRTVDIAARMGGDEFSAIFPETGYEDGKLAIQRIKNKLQNAIQSKDLPITFSIGALTCINPAPTFETIMAMADIMMYVAKKEGKNQVRHEIFDRVIHQGDWQKEIYLRNPGLLKEISQAK